MKLSTAIIPQLLKVGQVAVPNYDRDAVTAGILHVGLGNFHRAHMAAYVDDLLNTDFDNHKPWGIVGASLFDTKKRQILKQQDWLQTLVERDGNGAKASLIGSMIDFVLRDPDDATDDYAELKQTLVDPNIKIVSLTLTEGGYFLSDGAFDPTNDKIQADVKNADMPKTIFGMMVLALKQRRQAGVDPFTVMCCDNIPHNGGVVRSVVVGLAALTDKELSAWIDQNVHFPDSMVDRIVPATTDANRAFVSKEYGYQDALPVFCEPFRQWVLADDFPKDGRPLFEQCEGVKFVDDVAPYELMKIRILNGGHASLCYPSALLGVNYVHESMEHPTIGPFLDTLEKCEIIPTVPPVPDGTSLTDYWQIIASRFANPTIEDTIDRNCYDGASRQPKFIVPVAADALKAGGKVDGLATVSALWCRYCQGTTESGETIAANDPQWDRLQANAKKAAAGDVAAWLGMKDVYGDDVGTNPTFAAAFEKALQTIQKDGVEVALQQYIDANAEVAAAA